MGFTGAPHKRTILIAEGQPLLREYLSLLLEGEKLVLSDRRPASTVLLFSIVSANIIAMQR